MPLIIEDSNSHPIDYFASSALLLGSLTIAASIGSGMLANYAAHSVGVAAGANATLNTILSYSAGTIVGAAVGWIGCHLTIAGSAMAYCYGALKNT